MTSAFDRSFDILLGHEGGYVNHSADPGGETRWGISKRSYPAEDIKNLSVDRAKQIYKRDFWDKCRCDELPPPLALLVFDASVNCGPSRSVKWLQKAVGANPDGAAGPRTAEAVRAAVSKRGGGAVCREVLVQRLLFHIGLPTWGTFGLGWARRIIGLPFEAMQMASGDAPHVQ
jgi:lysozyme family protein